MIKFQSSLNIQRDMKVCLVIIVCACVCIFWVLGPAVTEPHPACQAGNLGWGAARSIVVRGNYYYYYWYYY